MMSKYFITVIKDVNEANIRIEAKISHVKWITMKL